MRVRDYVGTYREQYGRMMRSFSQLEEIYRGKKRPSDVLIPIDWDFVFGYVEECKDVAYAFSQNCYHLKDWIKNDPDVPSGTELCIESFIRNNVWMSICADLCNGSKHFELRNPKTGDKDTGLKRTNVTYWKRGSDKVFPNIDVESGGQIYDALSIAENCIAAWNSFLARHNLPA